MNNLVLIGFMGSGKSSVGRALAQKTARFFLDTDALIESATNRRISDIFALEGETAFRERERELAAWLESSVNNAVISAGGGMIVSCANLKRAGEIVYLKCDFDTILKRLEGEAEREKRPLAASIETLRERFGAREAIYDRAADRVIDATRPIAAIVETILQTPQS